MSALVLLCLLQNPVVWERAHSHNDYLRKLPLVEALDNGFCSVEADVFLQEGRLLVAHDRKDLDPNRTFEGMYLRPLSERLRSQGSIHKASNKTFWVLVDIKTEGEKCYQQFKRELANYPNLMYKDETYPVRFVISGDRPIDSIVADDGKFAGFDGRWSNIDDTYSVRVMPWISDAWLSHFSWLGISDPKPDQAEKLANMAKRVHEKGRKIRFWGAPDSEAIWKFHWEAGVDFINTDRPSALSSWLAKQRN